ncbi:peptidoglycan-binding protein [Micromonospora chersina]|uniref:peptidoglycan-binding domain-containing protein n=1 Tax=Micromonospora chersina TaxID=47854 RepID=UPI00368A462A
MAFALVTAAVGSAIVAAESPAYALATCTRSVRVEAGLPVTAPIPSTGSTGASTLCSLNPGVVNNAAVKILQESLNACYSNPDWMTPVFEPDLVPDGDFGDKTKKALIAVQSYHQIRADGGYGKQTRDSIMWWNRTKIGGLGSGGSCGWIDHDANGVPIVA